MERRWSVWGLLLGLVVWGGWSQRQAQRLGRELEALRSAVSVPAPEASEEPAAPAIDPGIDRVAAELSALRGEVVALRNRLEERLHPEERRPVPVGGGAGAERGEVGAVGKSVPGYIRSGWVDRSGIPDAVLEGFRRQLGEVVIEGAHMKQSGGRLFYSMESKTAEGRHMELSLDQTGQVVRSRVEMDLAALPEALQGTVQQSLGDIPAPRVALVFEDGKTVYRVQAKAPDHAVEMVLSPEGQVLRSETMFRQKKP
ncbi:MAG: hypothetical protein RIT19_2998 [Verrucomicrobiota bacterium]|jgi:uncharacterized membrane protein YkoI